MCLSVAVRSFGSGFFELSGKLFFGSRRCRFCSSDVVRSLGRGIFEINLEIFAECKMAFVLIKRKRFGRDAFSKKNFQICSKNKGSKLLGSVGGGQSASLQTKGGSSNGIEKDVLRVKLAGEDAGGNRFYDRRHSECD